MKKRLISILLALVLLCSFLPQMALRSMAADDDFVIDQNGVLTKYNGPGGAVAIPDGVTSIGDGAFENCSSLTSVTIPGSVTSIGVEAFYNCSSLTIVTIQDGVMSIGWRAFGFCTRLTSITIPDGMTKIDAYAFSFCRSLKSVTIPNGVTSIGVEAFSECSSLQSITIPKSVTEIGELAFLSCSNLTNITIPNSVTSIGFGAFQGCSSLKSITIPDNVTTIDGLAFYRCSSLTSVTIPDSVTSIGGEAFSKCSSLKSITIPDSVTSIEDGSFEDCISLTNLVLGRGIKQISSRAFQGTGLSSVRIPESVEYLFNDAFPDKTKLIFEKKLSEDSDSLIPTNNPRPYPSKDKREDTMNIIGGPFVFQMINPIINMYCWKTAEGQRYRLENGDKGLILEEYSDDNSFIKSWIVPIELSFFGGFFAGSEGYYFVFGADNLEEDDSSEVMRVVKYSKNWKRMGSASLYGANTRILFYMGSLRMTETNTDLYIHTCHIMYGGHQANLTLSLNKEQLIWTNQFYEEYGGYVSHSFNQFIEADKDTIVTVDHGDAYPRSIVLHTFANGMQDDLPEKNIDLFSFSGERGDNYTGASVSGLAVLDDSYLVAFRSIDQAHFDTSKTYNVWLSIVKKSEGSSRNLQVTFYPEGGEHSAAYLKLVQIDKDLVALLWEDAALQSNNPKIQIAFFDGAGRQLGKTQILDGTLSNCEPTMIDGAVTWYSGNKDQLTFYSFVPIRTESNVQMKDCHAKQLAVMKDTEKPSDEDKPSKPSMPAGSFRFDDVKNSKAFYYEPVYWAYGAKPQVTNGIDKNHFGPDQGCTRGQVVTFLWRAAGCPKPKNKKTAFADVGEKAFYAEAVAWAVERGITKGMSATSFAPDATCTRGQIVTFLWRFQKSPAPKSTKTGFKDVSAGAFYAKAVAWAVENKITNGMSATSFAPNATCTRGQIVTFLYRAVGRK